MPDSRLNRRLFALLGGFGVLAAGCAAVQSNAKPEATPATSPTTAQNGNGMAGMDMSPTALANPTSARAMSDAMDANEEAKLKSFPVKTNGQGNQPFLPKLDGTTKVFDLTASHIQWEIEPGKLVEAMAYNNQVPGPEIRVTEGDRVRVVLHNELTESTAIHFHGLRVPNDQDGVPFITQPPVKSGETFTYEFTVKPAGSHMYHSHHNAMKQVSLGMLGAFIVEPKDPTTRPAFDKDYTMVLNDGQQGFTFNGKSFPATQPLTAKLGQKVLIRFMNEGMMIHPMHLHGMPMQVIAKDGYLLPQPYMCDTLNIAPGDRWEVLVDADNPGVWAFHCHILPHAEGDKGMFGMVTALVVEK
jgi:manganese oxidase